MLFQKLWYSIPQFIFRFLTIVFLRLRVFGQHNVPPAGGAIIAANHQSYLDPILLGISVARPINFMARQELFQVNSFFKWLIQSFNAFPLARRPFDSSGIREAINRLKQGGVVVVFPEGGRTFDGNIREIKTGFYLLAEKANVPIIPTLINGSFEVWSRHHNLPVRLGQISIIYGRPIKINQYPSPHALAQHLHQELVRLQKILKINTRSGIGF